jgi:hypothetical protein
MSKLTAKAAFDKASKPIYVTVPASVAFDLGKMNKITETVLGKLGCPGCHSGFDLRFDFERRFAFDEKLAIIGQR